MMSQIEHHYTGIHRSLRLLELLYKLHIISTNRFMASLIELNDKPHNLILGG